MAVAQNITQLIGKTPILRLSGYERLLGLKAGLFAKLEAFNPAGSVKDRIALAMINDLEKSGKLEKGGTIIEPTSGNTGIGIAAIAAARGYRAIFTMPETMSAERRTLLKAYGAQLVLTDGAKGMKGAIEKAQQLANETGGHILGQFSNPANPAVHYETTGPEIWQAMDKKVDAFVAGVGTGGTITGTGRFLKEQNPAVHIAAAEPAASAVLSGKPAGPHKIQGIGAGFVPEILDLSLLNEIIQVQNEDAFEAARNLPKTDGFLAGISSGAALYAATQLAMREDFFGKNIVVVFPDTGERYLSTALFQNEA